MTNQDLRKWQKQMGYTYDSAALALGMHRATYARHLKIETVDRTVELACAALSVGIAEYKADQIKES